MKKEKIKAIIMFSAVAFISLETAESAPLLSSKLNAEKCVLIKSVQDSKNPYDALLGVNAINIFLEKTIMNSIDAEDIKKPNDTLISFSFKERKSQGQTEAVGDQIYPTIQSYLAKDANGLVFDIFNASEINTFQNVYVHEYKKADANSSLSIKATHTVVQYIDHWATKDVIVHYEKTEKNPIKTQTFKGIFTFKCNEFDRAVDMLKEAK